MVLPIVAYGDPVLRKETEEITKDYPNLDSVLETCSKLCMKHEVLVLRHLR